MGILKGQIAVVTGAGSGIGAATAARLAAEGAEVLLAGRRLEHLEAVAEGIRARGGSASTCVVDVTDPAQVRSMVAQTGPVDLLVNNAGLAHVGPVRDFAVADWDAMMAVNVKGVFLCSQAVLPGMLNRGAGHIVNVASVAARVGFPEWSAYCASKAAVAGFSRALLEEVRGRGIRVSVLYPGGVDTPLWDSFPNDFNRSRMLTAADVADAVAFVVTRPGSALVEDLALTYPLGNQ